MNQKIIRLSIAALLISAVMIISGCAKPAPPETPTLPEETPASPPRYPPVAQISATPSTVKFGESITFSGAASTDSDGNITSYEWDFGNGDTASGETITYTYSDIGAYNVKLTVSDNDGLSDPTEVSVKIILGSIKIEATASAWRGEPYDIYSAIKQKLEKAGFDVVPPDSTDYDAILFVDYKETQGALYTSGGYGTRITCNLRLEDKAENRMFETEIYAVTSGYVLSGSLYSDAVDNFEAQVYFKCLGEIIASKIIASKSGIDEVSVLIHFLKDEDWYVRSNAAEALGEIGDARAVEPLIQALLGDESEGVRGEAAGALGHIGDARAVEPLIQALKDEDWWVRKEAAWALGKIGDERAIEPLTQALNDEEELVRAQAEAALEKIRGY